MSSAIPVLGHRVRAVRTFVKDVWGAMWRDDVPFYAAGIAFHSLFSIFALLFLLSLIVGLLGKDPDNLRTLATYAAGLRSRKGHRAGGDHPPDRPEAGAPRPSPRGHPGHPVDLEQRDPGGHPRLEPDIPSPREHPGRLAHPPSWPWPWWGPPHCS